MRFSKSLFIAFAGLGLFACSNEDVTNNAIEGDATVTVSINDVIARNLEAPSTGTNGQQFAVQLKDAKLTLEAGSGAATIDVTDLSKTYEFKGVRNPSKITFVNNGGVESGLELKNVATQGLAEPLYASTSEFQRESETSYKVTLKPEHRVARLQFSGIKHDDKGEACLFQSATLQGVFLNGAALKEGVSGVKTATANEGQEAEALWKTISTSWGTDAPVFDAVEDGDNFLTDQNGWPRENKCFAYNIIPAGEGETVTALPKFTVALSNVAVKDNSTVVTSNSTVRFATVAKYKLDGELTDKAAAGVAEDGTIKTFKAGYIYNITGLSVSDEDLGTTPEGGKDATVVATVTVTPWTLVNGTVEWN